ncbi:SGNH/GDSL hydrolase family protein [Nocardioides sambongensis]|uniref:SGNH/GDSL hydrolase family protein n=1 Tax=Nocardioides sambongensis TaxID=2589074 RepID=UPI001E5C5673|nr:SGNH/GDSL hydrolase family protein [Nocardioides sambongensis]
MVLDALIPGRFRRYVAVGDSFTEGVGDPDPGRPNGVRGWADRFAEALAAGDPAVGYANLAIRGRKLAGILDEQLAPAVALRPDLVTVYAGGNDILRPRVDIDALITRYDDAIAQLRGTGATVLVWSAFGARSSKAWKPMRGRFAYYNEGVREIADSRGAVLVDYWRMREYDDWGYWDVDRLHMSSAGHALMAIKVLERLGIRHDLPHPEPIVRPVLDARAQRAANRQWAREHLGPWVQRRVTGRSSGDGLSPKYPDYVSPLTWAPLESAQQ